MADTNVLAGARVVRETVRCGSTAWLLLATSQAELARMRERVVRGALKAGGHAVVFGDGSKVFVDDRICNPLVWNADGNRVRAMRTKVSVGADGIVSEKVLRRVWVRL